MNSLIVDQLPLFSELRLYTPEPVKTGLSPNLHDFWLHPEHLPLGASQSPVIMRLLDLFGPLNWGGLPKRDLKHNYGRTAISSAALIIMELVRLNESKLSHRKLQQWFLEQPAFISLLGLNPPATQHNRLSFNTAPLLPSFRHLVRMLRKQDNAALQFLLADSIRLIGLELDKHKLMWGDCVSLDTKHILAWVKENNPKAYVSQRYNKLKQPAGDPDCRLGCKRRRNVSSEAPPTPTKKPVHPKGVSVGEFYWGYGSGVVVTKVPRYGEFVLAELTQPFDHGDVSYFFPLMKTTEERLGRRPLFGTFDAAFDAWYVYQHFYRDDSLENGFAAVPFSKKGGKDVSARQFSSAGLPICAAGLPMPLQVAFTDRTSCQIEHERGRYVCPLLFPTQTADSCPVNHKQWKHGGCTAMMPTAQGTRIRYTLDRDSTLYKDTYKQRTAVERINSQAVALGIERPHLRNGRAIANQNTLIYLLINLRFLQRLRTTSMPVPVN